MSVQSEIDRIAAARDDIAAAITEQGVPAPAGTKLAALAGLVRQIAGKVLSVCGKTPDSAGNIALAAGDVGAAAAGHTHAALPYRYKAALLADAWAGSGPYTQTAALAALDAGAPAVQAGSAMASGPLCEQTGVQATNEALLAALGIVNAGTAALGAGQVSVTVFERPAADIEAIWLIKEG